MSPPKVDQPILFIGMPRSGTTLLFAGYSAHPDLGWFSQYVHRFPRFTPVALLSRLADVWPASRAVAPPSGRAPSLIDRLRIMPSETGGGETGGDDYGVWSHCCGEEMANSFLIDVEPAVKSRNCLRSTVAGTLRFQGKSRFAGKLTGPPRIEYLSKIFPDALIIHVVRDPRAVVSSLLRVPFWRDTFRYTQPAWRGGLKDEDLAAWAEAGGTPAGLAAIEWRAVVGQARAEAARIAPDRYREIRYEDFIAQPHEALDGLFEFSRLSPSQKTHDFLDQRLDVKDFTVTWKERLNSADIQAVGKIIGAAMGEFDHSF